MLRYDQPLGRLIRLPLKAIPDDAVLPVLSGPNRGRRWIVGAGTHGCWLGRYERQEIEWFLSKIGPNSIVWDIGAHAGFFTLACATRCHHVVACEALPDNAAKLLRHLRLNRIANVTTINAAIGKETGFVSFGGSTSSYENKIGNGDTTVPMATIDGLAAAGHPPPTIIKMDIEGAETGALNGAVGTLTAHRPDVLLAVHGEDRARDCRALLERLGYHVELLNIATFWATANTR